MINSTLTESEAKIQSDCYLWFHNNFTNLRGLLYHVPNGELRDPITAKKLQAMGVVPGIPDICFHYKSNTYFLEFKKPKTGKTLKDQKKIHEALETQGFTVWIIDSLGQFIQLIQHIVERKDPFFTYGVKKNDYFYRHKIFSYLYEMGDAELVLIDNVCEDETRSKFIRIVSEFMDQNYDLLANFSILFTPDFKAFYKKLDGSDQKVYYNGATVVEDF